MSNLMITHTRIQLTVEISGSTYGPEWTVGDIVKQVSRESKIEIANILQRNNVVIIGEPIVKVVTAIPN